MAQKGVVLRRLF